MSIVEGTAFAILGAVKSLAKIASSSDKWERYCQSVGLPPQDLNWPTNLDFKFSELENMILEQRFVPFFDSMLLLVDSVRGFEVEGLYDPVEVFRRLLIPPLLIYLRTSQKQTRIPWLYAILVILLFLDDKTVEWYPRGLYQERMIKNFLRNWEFSSRGGPSIVVDAISTFVAIVFKVKLPKVRDLTKVPILFSYGWDDELPYAPHKPTPIGCPESEVTDHNDAINLATAEELAGRSFSLLWNEHVDEVAWNADISESGVLSAEVSDTNNTVGQQLGLTLIPVPRLGGIWAQTTGGLERIHRKLGDWTFEGHANLAGGVLIPVTQREGMGASSIDLSASLRRHSDEPILIDGSAVSFSIENIAIEAGMRTGIDFESPLEPEVALRVQNARLKVTEPDSGLLRKVLPSGLEIGFDVGLLLNRDGLQFEGALGLDAYWPLNQRLGVSSVGAEIRYLRLKLNAGRENGKNQMSALGTVGVKFHVGPIEFLMEELGARLALSESDNGNLVVANLGFDSQWPKTIGMSIANESIKGAGVLSHDADSDTWAGGLELKIGTLQVSGIGIVQSGEQDNFLVMASLAISGGPLEAIGILVAGNRRGAPDEFIAGLREGALDAVLFPENPVSQFSHIVSAMNRFFPYEKGRFVVGMMARLRYAAVFTAELGILFEFSSSQLHHVYLLGQGKIRHEKISEEIWGINLEMFGDWNIVDDTALLLVTLRDSRIARTELSGDGLLYKAQDGAKFLALGGFHSRYPAPTQFGDLRRLSVSLASSSHFRLDVELYVAITSNSFQVGAEASLLAKAAGFSLEGRLGVEVLFMFQNSEFLGDFWMDAAIKRGSRVLLSMGVSGTLSGTSSWQCWGRATFSFLWWEKSIPFGSRPDETKELDFAEPSIEEDLQAALLNPARWSSRDSDVATEVVAGGGTTSGGMSGEGTTSETIWVAPGSTIVVEQNTVPFEQAIDYYGASKLDGTRRFTVSEVNGSAAGWHYSQSRFAPGLFFDMSEDELLSAPAFEELDGGVVIESGVTLGEATSVDMDYDEILIDDEAEVETPVFPLFAALHLSALQLAPVAGIEFYRTNKTPLAISDKRFVNETNPTSGGDSYFSGRSQLGTAPLYLLSMIHEVIPS